MRLKVAALVVGAVLSVSMNAGADVEVPVEVEPLRIGSAATCRTAAGSTFAAEAGSLVIPAARWVAADVEIRRLQTAETRLAAENRKLRELADAGPGWGTVAAVVVGVAAGFAGGVYVTTR